MLFRSNLECAIRLSTNGAVASWTMVGTPSAKHGLLAISSSYTGIGACDSSIDIPTGSPVTAALSLTDGQSGLQSGQSEEIDITVRVTLAQAASGSAVITNVAYLSSFGDSNIGRIVLGTTSISAESLLVDPSGVVYDSVTRQPISGAFVTIARQS